jgi:SAM-dependent MidA family methyltransferase
VTGVTYGWRTATDRALYGPDGFFRDGAGPAAHFRTSVHASPLFAGAILRLIEHVDEALDHPARLDVVDVGAGRGELLTALSRAADLAVVAGDSGDKSDSWGTTTARSTPWLPLRERVRFVGVEVAGRPEGLPASIFWGGLVPDAIVGVLLATEWLDNVPVDIAEVDSAGVPRRVLVDAAGAETLGDRVDPADAFWLGRWWPLDDAPAGTRAEIGWPRDLAWADAVDKVERGCALAVDYGHLRSGRPPFGTLTGYRDGQQVTPVPDGSGDVTAHVAVDAVAAAPGVPYRMRRQREALRALGVDGGRPPLSLASSDPSGYIRALSTASSAAELTDSAGLGAHWWLLHEVGIDLHGKLLA